MKYIILILIILTGSLAIGPTKVATFDRALWDEPIHDNASFNRASRHEIVSYVNQIISRDLSSKKKIKAFVDRKHISLSSLNHWKAITQERLLRNFKEAQKSCKKNEALCLKVSTWNDLVAISKNYQPTKTLQAWYKASQTFFSYYLYEQARLASIFPKTTSEIDVLDHSEMQGFDYKDGEFLLTFDDGPKYSRTKAIATMLRKKDIHGLFFVLGNNLESSIKKYGAKDIANLYKGSCVSTHGFIHKSYQHLKDWESSYKKSRDLIQKNGLNSSTLWFRPPYGQRHKMLINYLATLGDRVMLWNIDSQDWNRKLNAKKIEDRVLTLMLLHRKGIILFHDIHPKAIKVVEALNRFRSQGVNWVDCTRVQP